MAVLTLAQQKALEFLWLFKYGNGGFFYTPQNHKYFELRINGKHDEAEKMMSLVSPQCRAAYDRVLQNNFRELTESQRKFISEASALDEFYKGEAK